MLKDAYYYFSGGGIWLICMLHTTGFSVYIFYIEKVTHLGLSPQFAQAENRLDLGMLTPMVYR